MNRGAPHEAEIALSTVIDHLPEIHRSKAQLLIADALQEQGRWRESLDYLSDAVSTKALAALEDETFVRVIKAKTKIGGPHHSHDDLDLERLISLAIGDKPLSLRLAALHLAARISEHMGASYQDPRLIGTIADLDVKSLKGDQLGDLTAAKALLLQRKDFGKEAIALLHYGLTTLRNAGMLNSKVNTLLNGLGCVLCSAGAYDRALTAFTEGFDLAVTRGDDQLTATICSNLSLCCMRLMRHEEQIVWHERGMALPEMFGTFRIWWNADVALAYHMTGRFSDAHYAVDRTQRGYTTNWPAPHRQLLHLQLADSLFVMGEPDRAREEAQRGLSLGSCSIAASGRYARWLARLAVTSGTEEKASEAITDMVSTICSYDVIDQVDILHAALLLSGGKSSTNAILNQLAGRLDRLPAPTIQHLSFLGFDEDILEKCRTIID